MGTQQPTDTDAATPEARPESSSDQATESEKRDTPPAPASSGDIRMDEVDADRSTDATDEQSEIDRLNEELQRYKDQLVRLAAEFDNYKKRTSREFGTLVKNANESLITQLLPTLDNMNRALQAPRTTEETELFAAGFEMIVQQLHDLLKKEGVQAIDVTGAMFDPTKHEAVMAIERDDQPPYTIIEEIEKGYTLYDKMLRPSKVVVSQSPVEHTEEASETDQSNE